MDVDAREIIRLLDLRPHPEGGFYRETWGTMTKLVGKTAGTSFYYLLSKGQLSRWHRATSNQTWHWYAGAPLELILSEDEEHHDACILGPDLDQSEEPQIFVPKLWWQKARTLGDWTLVQCTAASGYVFEGYDMTLHVHTSGFMLS
jgi:predicted cupin superfamily sugar epimerase